MGGARGGAGTPGVGPGGLPPGGMDMLGQVNPEMMESAVKMMRNMDPQALSNMLVSAGMAK